MKPTPISGVASDAAPLARYVFHPWAFVVVAAFYACAIVVLGLSLRRHFGFPLDDSWIHQTIGRNFSQYGSLGYLPHQRSSGSTSLLWTLILSFNYSFLPKLSPVLYCLAFNSICLIGIGLMLLRIALRDGMSPGLAIMWASAAAADGNFVWLTFTGMEHLLFIALSIASILLWRQAGQDDVRGSYGNASLAGLCMGLLCVTRPEGIILPLLLLVFFRWMHRTAREAAVAGSITLVLAAFPFTVNLITSGALLPVTFKGRQWLYFAGHAPGLVYREQLFEQWITRPVKALFVFDGSSSGVGVRLLILGSIACIVILCVFGLYWLFSQRYATTFLVCVWAAIHSLLYLVILPVSGHGGRYQPFLMLLLAPLAILGLYRCICSVTAAPIALSAAVLVVAAFGVRSLSLWHTVLADGVDHIGLSHGAMAAYLNRAHITQPVAVFDIGRIGYDRGGNLVDLGGLTDAAYVSYLYNNQVPEYLKEHSISLVILPDAPGQAVIGEELGLVGNPEVILRSLHRDCTPVSTWIVGWVETRNAAQCQELFEISFR